LKASESITQVLRLTERERESLRELASISPMVRLLGLGDLVTDKPDQVAGFKESSLRI